MKVIDYFLTPPENRSLLYKQKAVVLTILDFVLLIILSTLIVITLSRTDLENNFRQTILPFVMFILVILDLVILKIYAYRIASNFLTLSIAVAFVLQLIFIVPEIYDDDFLTTFYFVFAIFSLSAIFSSKEVYFFIVVFILIGLVVNVIQLYDHFPPEFVKRLPSIILFYIFSLTLSTLFTFITIYFSNSSQLKIIEDSKQIYELYNELQFKNQNLERIVEDRTKEVAEQHEIIKARNEDLLQRNEEINTQKEELYGQSETLKIALETVEEQHNEINAAIRYALTIQNSILPLNSDLEKVLDFFLLYKPFGIVSGDFYWFADFKTSRFENIYFAMVDCTGHGVPGAFMSLLGHNLLNEIVKKSHIFDTNLILETLDKEVREVLKQDRTKNHDGMDMSVCQIHRSDKKNYIEFSGAKRPLLIYSKADKTINYIKGDYRSIGGYHTVDIKFSKHKINVEKGDLIYLFSDGITDQINEKNKKFGLSNLKLLIEQNAEKPLEEQKQIFDKTIDEHQGIEMQIDDMSLICIKI